MIWKPAEYCRAFHGHPTNRFPTTLIPNPKLHFLLLVTLYSSCPVLLGQRAASCVGKTPADVACRESMTGEKRERRRENNVLDKERTMRQSERDIDKASEREMCINFLHFLVLPKCLLLSLAVTCPILPRQYRPNIAINWFWSLLNIAINWFCNHQSLPKFYFWCRAFSKFSTISTGMVVGLIVCILFGLASATSLPNYHELLGFDKNEKGKRWGLNLDASPPLYNNMGDFATKAPSRCIPQSVENVSPIMLHSSFQSLIKVTCFRNHWSNDTSNRLPRKDSTTLRQWKRLCWPKETWTVCIVLWSSKVRAILLDFQFEVLIGVRTNWYQTLILGVWVNWAALMPIWRE